MKTVLSTQLLVIVAISLGAVACGGKEDDTAGEGEGMSEAEFVDGFAQAVCEWNATCDYPFHASVSDCASTSLASFETCETTGYDGIAAQKCLDAFAKLDGCEGDAMNHPDSCEDVYAGEVCE